MNQVTSNKNSAANEFAELCTKQRCSANLTCLDLTTKKKVEILAKMHGRLSVDFCLLPSNAEGIERRPEILELLSQPTVSKLVCLTYLIAEGYHIYTTKCNYSDNLS